MIYFSHILTFVIFLVVGLSLGKRTFKHTNKSYDYTLIILTILSLYVGVGTYLLKIFDFEVIASTVMTAILLGIVLRRYDRNLTLVQKFKNLI